MAALTPIPILVTAPGVRVNVQVPVAGKSLKTTLAVAKLQLGWVIIPMVGAVGVAGCVLISTLVVAMEEHPDELATVNV